MPLLNWKDIADALKNVVTSGALLAGGIWSYRLFVRQRLGLPRLKATITPYAVRIEQGWILNVQVQIENIGSVVAAIKRAELRMRQVVPLPDCVASKIIKGFDPVAPGEAEVGWPMLAGREWSWEAAACEIEPGETDALTADFFAPADVEVLQFYFFAANEKKRRRSLGWPATMIHELQDKEQIAMAEQKGVQFRNGQQQPQQKQQPQQRPQQQVQPQQQQTQVSKKK